MGVTLSRVGGARTVSALVAVLAAVVTYCFYQRFCIGGARRPPRVGAGKDSAAVSPPPSMSPSAAAAVAPKDSNDTAAKKRGPLKGPAPQKLDVFSKLVTEAFPTTITEQEARRRFPRKFEAHGHVVVVRMNDGVSVEEFRPLAQAFAQCFSPIDVDVILLDREGIVGELRRPQLEELFAKPREEMSHLTHCPRVIAKRWRESRAKYPSTFVPKEDLDRLLAEFTTTETFTVHVENGVRYSFDVNKVMFCSGNTTERMHFAEIDATGETVVDMFVGIGYFSLPLAMHGDVAVIHALDKNPDSIAFVRLNAVHNRVDHLLNAQCGDNRVIGEELGGKCDRVIMGLIPTCKEFLPRAVFFLKRSGEAGRPTGIVHYHYLADKPAARKTALDDVREELGDEAAANVTIVALRCVKSYAPKRFHYVADLKFQ